MLHMRHVTYAHIYVTSPHLCDLLKKWFKCLQQTYSPHAVKKRLQKFLFYKNL